MSTGYDDELFRALVWLHGTDDNSAWRSRPPTARILHDLRCQRPGERCLLGGFYATPAGIVFYGLNTVTPSVTNRLDGFDPQRIQPVGWGS